MSSYGFNYYPKNWHSNGYGWINMQALAYATGKETPKDTTDGGLIYPASGQGMFPPLPGSAALSYGFSDNVLNPQPSAPSLYPRLDFADDSDITAPREESPVRQRPPQELLCTAVHVPADQNSYWEIMDSFGFDFIGDEFGFFSNLDDMDESMEVYASCFDKGSSMDCCLPRRRRRIVQGTRNVRIKTVFEPGKRLLFFYDYSLNWEFVVDCMTTLFPNPDERYPYICHGNGYAPDQFHD